VSALVYVLKYGPSISVVTFYSRLQFCGRVIFSLTQTQPNIPLKVWRSVQRNYVIVNDLTHSDTKLHLKELHHSTYCHCAEFCLKILCQSYASETWKAPIKNLWFQYNFY